MIAPAYEAALSPESLLDKLLSNQTDDISLLPHDRWVDIAIKFESGASEKYPPGEKSENWLAAASGMPPVWPAVQRQLPPLPPMLLTTSEQQIREADEFLADVYVAASSRDLEAATDRVFDHMDRLLHDGEIGRCKLILSRIDLSRLPTALMRSFLTITAPAKQELEPVRSRLYLAIERVMSEQKGVEKTRRLIGRLA